MSDRCAWTGSSFGPTDVMPWLRPRPSPSPPELITESGWRRSIRENTPAVFPIVNDPRAQGKAPLHSIWDFGVTAVRKYNDIIEEEARRAERFWA